VDLRLLLQPEHADQTERHFAAARVALKYYGDWFGPYPYSHLTIVDPAWRSNTDGMEYPTLITAGTSWLAPAGVDEPEDVVVHEAGHQWWYGLVGNDEFDYALLDEGFNTFSTARALEAAYPTFFANDRFFGGFIPWVYRDVPEPRENAGDRIAGYRNNAKIDIPSTPSWRYTPRVGGLISYNKTAVWLHTLERMLGWPMLQRIMSTYFERYRFKHPTPADFFSVANEVSGQDLTWFFDQVYRSADVFDYGIQTMTSRRVTISGYIETTSGQRRVVDEQTRGDTYQTHVFVRRYGEAIFPVDVVTTFEDGSQAKERWDGRGRWIRYTYERPTRAVSAVVDPDRVLLLDVNYTNNSFTLKPEADAAATKWSLAWLVWLQDLLVTSAFFG
jgi:Peptidase family M1 domain